MAPSDPRPTASVTHYRDLDGMRGVLAVAVMLFHYGVNVMIARLTRGWVAYAPWELCVDFFFVLSGCVLTRSYLARPRGIARRFVERVFRLLPVHLLTALAFVPLVWLAPLNLWFHATRGRPVGALIADLTTTSPYIGLEQWNFAAWTVGIELYLPVLLAALLPVARKMPTAVLAAVFTVLVVLEARCVAEVVSTGAWTVKRGLLGLSTGGTLYLLLERNAIAIPRTHVVLPILLLVLLAAIGLAATIPLLPYVLPVLFVAAVALGTNAEGLLGRGVFRWLGLICYSVYLVHLPAKAWTYYLLGVNRFDGMLGIKAVLIAAVLGLASLITWYVEIPGIRLGKQLARALAARAASQMAAHPDGDSLARDG